MFYKKSIRVTIDSIGPSIILRSIYTDVNEKPSFMISFFSNGIKIDQLRTAYSCRGWAWLKQDVNLISRCGIILMRSFLSNVHMMALFINRL